MSGLLRLALAGLGVWAASGCGQKGALYLPDQAPQAVKSNPAAPASAQSPERRKTPPAPAPATTR